MTNLFQVLGSDLVPLQRTKLASEDQIEGWIARDPRRIGLDVLIVGRQVTTAYGGRIDLLGLDREGNTTIIELKRDRTPREIVSQVLDYASWVRKLSAKDINDIAIPYLQSSLAAAFESFFSEPMPETLNGSHSMIIVASEFDDASRRIVEYLSDEHGISINTAFFNVFEHKGETLLATDWLVDQEQVVENAKAKRAYPWSGWYYANVGHDDGVRSWEDMRQFGFLAAGYGAKYSGPLKKLKAGDPIFAYQKQCGYVGYGLVTSEAVPASQFEVGGKRLQDLGLRDPGLFHDAGDAEKEDWVVAVDWKKSFPLGEAKTFAGAFANQNVVCRLTHPGTIEFLKQQFVEETPNAGAGTVAGALV